MTDNHASGVSACDAYRSDEEVIRLAKALAAEHACAVRVGRLVSEDTGETSPAFFLDPMPLVGGKRLGIVVEKHQARFRT